MHLRPIAALLLGVGLASCTALFLPTVDPVATTLELVPADITVRDLESATVTLTVLDQFGEPLEEIPDTLAVSWTVSDPELAFVEPGLVKGQKQGVGLLQVTVGALSATARVTVLGVPRFLRRVDDDARAGVVARPLDAPVSVRVVDRIGTGVADVPVTFKVTGGGGSVAAATVKSDAQGVARTSWVLGPKAGENTLEASAAPLKEDVIRFTATGSPDAVVRLDRVSGDLQQAAAGSGLEKELVVKAFDRNGNVVPSAPVSWSVDGGAITSGRATTDDQGIARARWTLGTVARAHAATARAGGAEAKFGATAVPGAPARLQIAGGDQQRGPEFQVLPDSLAVRVSDVYGNTVAGVPVTWLVTHGGGSFAAPQPSVTRANGVARATWTVGVSLPNALTATAAGQTVTFRAVARPLVPRDTLRTESGIRYLEVDFSRDTLIVQTGNLVSVYFSAYLLDGTLVERVRDKADPPLRFIVGGGSVIRGFDSGVLGMRKGSIRRLFLSPDLAYRDGTMDHIPPNSTLVFDIRVIEILQLTGGSAGGGAPSGSRLPGGGQRPREVPYNGDSR